MAINVNQKNFDGLGIVNVAEKNTINGIINKLLFIDTTVLTNIIK